MLLILGLVLIVDTSGFDPPASEYVSTKLSYQHSWMQCQKESLH